MTSSEKLKARAKATDSHKSSFAMAMTSMVRQKPLVITVNAFFSEKNFLNRDRSMENILFIMAAKVKGRR
jgi:hypothetical protein